jgi:hypothetical protein
VFHLAPAPATSIESEIQRLGPQPIQLQGRTADIRECRDPLERNTFLRAIAKTEPEASVVKRRFAAGAVARD